MPRQLHSGHLRVLYAHSKLQPPHFQASRCTFLYLDFLVFCILSLPFEKELYRLYVVPGIYSKLQVKVSLPIMISVRALLKQKEMLKSLVVFGQQRLFGFPSRPKPSTCLSINYFLGELYHEDQCSYIRLRRRDSRLRRHDF